MANKTPHTFEEMTPAQLRQFIDGCHRSQDYGGQFEAATLELNTRIDGGGALNDVLRSLGFTTCATSLYRKNVIHDGLVVLESATAGAVWEWLRAQKYIN